MSEQIVHEAILFQSASEWLAELVGMQHYDAETNRYYTITRVVVLDHMYTMYGVPLEIPELTDDSE